MFDQRKLIVSHAPFWHDGGGITERSYHTLIAALPAVLFGLFQYGMPAVGVISLSISSAILWEVLLNYVAKRTVTIGDGNAAVIGIVFGMLLPATAPWWLVLTGTFFAVIIGKQIFGGIGANAFNPSVIALAILTASWKDYFDFDGMLVNYEFGYTMMYPLTALKNLGAAGIEAFPTGDLLLGQQLGGIGSTFGLGLIIGGVYLILRGFVRWEISVSFLAGIFVTALIFNVTDSARFAGPAFHLVSGYTLIGAFFLLAEDSSSPVNFVPMILYGAIAGFLTVLIRNIGMYIDGVVFAILIANLLNPLLDNIRPKAIGKVV
jgi:electron transport complex protein RnfD